MIQDLGNIPGELLRHEIFTFIPEVYLYELSLVCRSFSKVISEMNLQKRSILSLRRDGRISAITINKDTFYYTSSGLYNIFGRLVLRDNIWGNAGKICIDCSFLKHGTNNQDEFIEEFDGDFNGISCVTFACNFVFFHGDIFYYSPVTKEL